MPQDDSLRRSRRGLALGPDDDGVIVLAMMIVLLVSSLMLLLVAQQVASARHVQHNRAFTRAVFVADQGLQQAIVQIRTGAVALPGAPGATVGPFTGTTTGGSGRTDSYSWSVTENTALDYTITSVGTAENKSRKVTQHYVQGSLFRFALFANTRMHFQGNGFVGSYDGRTGVQDPGNGNGLVGTNGAITLTNGVQLAGVGLFNNAGGASCSGNAACSPNPPSFVAPAPLPVTGQDAAIAAALAQCHATFGARLPAYVASQNNSSTSVPPAPPLHAGVNCFRSASFDAPVSPFPGTASNPVKVYIDADPDTVTYPSSVDVSTSDVGLGRFGPAAAFQIYVPNNKTTVAIAKNGIFVGALWAPYSACTNSFPSFEGVNVYGSMVCDTFGKGDGSQGNGNFSGYYDDSLGAIGDGQFAQSNFGEENP